MKLEPVLLVAPDLESASSSPRPGYSRRALLGGIALALGVGSSIGSMTARALLHGSGESDPMLAWALHVQDAPIAELLDAHEAYLAAVSTFRDDRLRRGVLRLADAVIVGASVSVELRSLMAVRILASMSSLPSDPMQDRRAASLRAIR